ncbi:uroporphyrinogen-III C-methyltransferase [Rickettsiella endosymbiont of Miltochrista miniata]|uniref:uroporphyrinogen-III C-methyltransferase n=1 Tax=Rickettsiella endosymbiont of Miltochrista miniata TaxID=3066239 RepID=UPI00313E7962
MESQPTPNLEEAEVKVKKNKPLRSKSCFTAWCAIGLLFITWTGLFLGLGFFWLKNRGDLNEYHRQLSAIQTQISQSQTDNKNLQQHISQLQNFIEQKFSANDNAILLANINQLIQLAQYNLVYFHDTDNALSALSLADKQLSTIISPDVRLENLHQLLTQYLTNLKALPHIDLTAILAQLQTLKAQITQLPLLATSNSTTPNPKATVGSSSENKWVSMLKNSLDSFRQLVVIRRLNKPIEPLLPEREQQYLQHNLILLLQQAQWALIHHEAIIYQSSLQEIQENIKDHFAGNSPITKTVMQSITQLQQIELQTPSLDLNPLLEAISIIKKTPINSNTTPVVTANQKEPS